jgi:phosphatidylethanolamine/phosphatidyl-N-methylethanolamine N-methyltransferase
LKGMKNRKSVKESRMSPEARDELLRHEQSYALFKAFGYDMDAVRWEVKKIAGKLAGPVLDVGTGPGARMACVLASSGLRVTTIDFSGTVQEVARAQVSRRGLLDRVDFAVMDAEAMSFDSGTFAAAAGVNILHDVSHPARVVEEMVRVIRPGGKVIVADLNKRGRDLVERVHEILSHVHPAGPLDWRSDVGTRLRKAGVAFKRHRMEWMTVYVGTKKRTGFQEL